MAKIYKGEILLIAGLFLFLSAVILVLTAPGAEAAGVTFSASTTVSLSGGDSLTVAGGSNASSVQVAANMVIALENTDSITVSVNNRNFSATGQSTSAVITRNTLCYSNVSNQQAIITLTATQNETVTLATSACGDYASGRPIPGPLTTYGGERLITSPAPTPTPAPTAAPTTELSVLPAKPTVFQIQLAISEVLQKINELRANPNVPFVINQLEQLVIRIAKIQQAVTSGVQPAAAGGADLITQPLHVGSSGNQVTALQNFLKSQGADVYPEGLITGYFGSLTREAVERLQEKYGIASEGDAGYGFVGPKTRAKINSLLGQ